MPDRSKSWDILTKRVKWWQTVKTGVPALNQALLSFTTLWVKLCWALLRFAKHWYALGALINSWQSAQNFWTVQKNLALLPNVPLYSNLSHDLLRPCRFIQALLRFGAALHAALSAIKAPLVWTKHDGLWSVLSVRTMISWHKAQNIISINTGVMYLIYLWLQALSQCLNCKGLKQRRFSHQTGLTEYLPNIKVL